MPQGGRERGHVAVPSHARLGPVPQRLERNAVAHIMQAWPMAVARATPADLAGEPDERGPYRPEGGGADSVTCATWCGAWGADRLRARRRRCPVRAVHGAAAQ